MWKRGRELHYSAARVWYLTRRGHSQSDGKPTSNPWLVTYARNLLLAFGARFTDSASRISAREYIKLPHAYKHTHAHPRVCGKRCTTSLRTNDQNMKENIPKYIGIENKFISSLLAFSPDVQVSKSIVTETPIRRKRTTFRKTKENGCIQWNLF